MKAKRNRLEGYPKDQRTAPKNCTRLNLAPAGCYAYLVRFFAVLKFESYRTAPRPEKTVLFTRALFSVFKVLQHEFINASFLLAPFRS